MNKKLNLKFPQLADMYIAVIDLFIINSKNTMCDQFLITPTSFSQ